MAALKEPMPIGSYILISEKNIFSPERKDFPITPLEQTKTNVHPQVILYGVTIAGDFQAASLVNPGRPLKKGERETMTVKIGEKIGEYKLAKIQPDRITMESNGDSLEVLLYDSRNPKKRMEVKAEVKPATVTSPQPSPQPTPVPSPGQEPKPPAPQESAEKQREPVQRQVAMPPPTAAPGRPNWPFPAFRRGPRPVYPTPGTPAPSPGLPTQGNAEK